ncbi:MAG: hypothetical protein MJ252_18610, partial [archaeon]|nr:hypothetical protein [archaeon]
MSFNIPPAKTNSQQNSQSGAFKTMENPFLNFPSSNPPVNQQKPNQSSLINTNSNKVNQNTTSHGQQMFTTQSCIPNSKASIFPSQSSGSQTNSNTNAFTNNTGASMSGFGGQGNIFTGGVQENKKPTLSVSQGNNPMMQGENKTNSNISQSNPKAPGNAFLTSSSVNSGSNSIFGVKDKSQGGFGFGQNPSTNPSTNAVNPTQSHPKKEGSSMTKNLPLVWHKAPVTQ